MKKILTIIIPTYNMEKYLRRCLDSLIINEEEMKKLEVLVINDGSKDSSSEIAHQYQDKYIDTFRVIDKENGNYGSCINRGLKEATGKYVKVLDSDDYFSQFFEEYLRFLDNSDCDLILSDCTCVRENNTEIHSLRMKVPKKSNFTWSDFKNYRQIQMHNITYNRSVFNGLNYHQVEGISYTDTQWYCTPMINVRTISYFPKSIYMYLIGRDGQTVDPKIQLKCVWMKEKNFFSICNDFTEKGGENAPSVEYLKEKIRFLSEALYQRYLKNTDVLMIEDLERIDDRIKKELPWLYNDMNNLVLGRHFKYRYINAWRKGKLIKIFINFHKIYQNWRKCMFL